MVVVRASQRLLAHKVAQYHGLQTSTADYEGSTGRVVAHRKCVETKVSCAGSPLIMGVEFLCTDDMTSIQGNPMV
eukprot:705964-Pelagomonas_calceolata.AAC.3